MTGGKEMLTRISSLMCRGEDHRLGERDGDIMPRSGDRILTTHTGSLPRPAELVRLYVDRSQGKPVDEATLAAAGHDAMRRVIAQQRAAGIDIPNNGEQQREAFFLYVRQRMSGFGGQWKRWPTADVARYPMFKKAREDYVAGKVAVGNFAPPKAIGDIKYLDRALVERECDDFRAALDAAPGGFVEPFLTAPSPGIIAAAMLNEHYPSEDAYLAALGAALRVEYQTIVQRGFLLQLDCPDLALERHVSYADKPLSAFQGFVERVVDTLNVALDGIPRERVRLHVCWGNYEGPHDLDVPLGDILPILTQAKVGGFVLPFANPRHAHEYRCLKGALADDQIIVAGVIDTLTNFVEHPEVVADRLEAVARTVGDPARVQAGTDCGFDTSAGMGRVTEDIVWAKLAAMSEGAAIASKRLF
jgi:5-methyltetrahydropteroyltriglutamate--homocysteine methyltransferase